MGWRIRGDARAHVRGFCRVCANSPTHERLGPAHSRDAVMPVRRGPGAFARGARARPVRPGAFAKCARRTGAMARRIRERPCRLRDVRCRPPPMRARTTPASRAGRGDARPWGPRRSRMSRPCAPARGPWAPRVAFLRASTWPMRPRITLSRSRHAFHGHPHRALPRPRCAFASPMPCHGRAPVSVALNADAAPEAARAPGRPRPPNRERNAPPPPASAHCRRPALALPRSAA